MSILYKASTWFECRLGHILSAFIRYLEKFEDTKIRSRKSKKDRQYNEQRQKDKKTNDISQEIKD